MSRKRNFFLRTCRVIYGYPENFFDACLGKVKGLTPDQVSQAAKDALRPESAYGPGRYEAESAIIDISIRRGLCFLSFGDEDNHDKDARFAASPKNQAPFDEYQAMKDSIMKVLPIVVGVAIGWLLFHPPAWLAPLGAARFLIMGVLGFTVLVVFIAFAIAASLPAEVGVGPHAGALDPSMSDLARQIRDLGFAEAGPPYRVEVRPAATLIAYVHPSEPVYATVFRTGTVPAVTSFDFVSIIEGFRGGLTTGVDWRGGTLPAGPGEFRQIVRGAGLAQAYHIHIEGVRWLRARGLPAKGISAATFVDDFKQAMVRQRKAFRSSLLTHALITLWRTVSKQVPQLGPLSAQKGAEAQVRKLATGR